MRPEFNAASTETIGTDQYRAMVSGWTKDLASTGGPALLFPEEFGGLGEVGAAIASFETLALSDLSLLVKCGVQFGLFGGAVHHLGTRPHHERYLDDIATFKLPGAFAMSESGHGSNVQNVQTRATYDPEAQEFVVKTPTEEDRKDYIGNAARDGQLAAVFCQLVVGGEERGRPLRPGPASRRRGHRPGRSPHRGLRPQARAQRRRQRAPLLRRRPRPAREPARPLRAGQRRGRVLQPDREREPPLLHDARHPDPGPDQRRRRLDQRHQGGPDDRHPPRPAPPPVRATRLGDGVAADGLPGSPAPAAAPPRSHLRAPLRPGGSRRRPRRDLRRGRRHGRAERGGAGGAPRARDARGRPEGPRHLARDPDDPGVPRGLRRRRLPQRESSRRAASRHRRLHHLRGRQHDPAPARRQDAAHRLPRPVRRAEPDGRRRLRRRARSGTPSSRRPRRARSSSA